MGEKLEKMNIIKGITSPDRQKKHDEEISNIRLEHNNKIETLNFEMLELKQKEIELDRLIDNERKKNSEISREYINLKDSKQRDQQKYEKRIDELIINFEAIQNTKINLNELEQNIHLLTIKNLELKEQAQNHIQKNDDLTTKLVELKTNFKTLLNEKEDINSKYNILYDANIKEKTILENTINSLENNMRIIIDDLNKSKEEISDLVNKVSELYVEQDEYKLNIETLFSDKMKLQFELDKIVSEKTDEILQTEKNLEKECVRYENAENERRKLQEVFTIKMTVKIFNRNLIHSIKLLIII